MELHYIHIVSSLLKILNEQYFFIKYKTYNSKKTKLDIYMF